MHVWVTRDEPSDGPLSSAIRSVGLDVLHAPVIKRSLVANPVQLLADMQEGEWLVLTSPYAINAVPVDVVSRARLAVVGKASRRAAQERGLTIAFSPSVPNGETLFQELAELQPQNQSIRIWYPRSAAAVLPLLPAHIKCESPILYETLPIPYDEEAVTRADVIALASSTAVGSIKSFHAPCASIGPTTTAALEERDVIPAITAAHPTFKELAAAIQAFCESRHQRA